MKLQVGLLYTDGRPATRQDLSTILGEYESWPADTSGEVLQGPLAMAYRGDRITWEEDNEVQPLRYGSYILTFDGRLDNRDALGSRLRLEEIDGVPDPMIVAQALQEFGQQILSFLIGEFALVAWNTKTRLLIVARSACGSRPFYHVSDGVRLFWSNDFELLVRISGVSLEPNQTYLLEYLVSQPSPNHSPLRKVGIAPAGMILRFNNGKVDVRENLWDANEVREIRYKSNQEYEEQFRYLLEEAVRVRLRTKNPVFAELSGGLDSSSIVLTADTIIRREKRSLEDLATVSCLFDSSQSCDESYFIRIVEQKRGAAGCHVNERDHAITLGLREVEFSGLPSPLHCYSGRYPSFAAFMKKQKAKVLLSGEGGDHVLWSVRDGAPLVGEALAKGQMFKGHCLCGAWSKWTGTPYIVLLAKSFALLGPRITPRFSQYAPAGMPDWLSNEYKRRFPSEVWDARASSETRGSAGFRAHMRLVSSLFSQLSAGYHSHYREIHVSYPYAHRPLVEFCLGTPVEQFLADGQSRSLARRALRHLLPPAIATRQSKGEVSECFARALEREWSDVGEIMRWEVVRRGFVDGMKLLQDLRKARLGLPPQRANFVRLFSLERWLRSLDKVRSRLKEARTEQVAI